MEVTGVGFCFFCKNAALRLAFLLSVDGLDLFLVLPLLTRAGPLPLVSRENEKVELMVREKLKAKPWPANTWQRSRHLAAKEESLPPTTFWYTSESIISWRSQKIAHASSDI